MFLFLTARSPTGLCVVPDPMHSSLLLHFVFSNDAPPIELYVSCNFCSLCSCVGFFPAYSGDVHLPVLSSHLDHDLFLPVHLGSFLGLNRGVRAFIQLLIMLILVFYFSADCEDFLVDLYDRPHCAMGFSYYWFVLSVYIRI